MDVRVRIAMEVVVLGVTIGNYIAVAGRYAGYSNRDLSNWL